MSANVTDLLNQRLFLTAAGTETYLIFQQGVELPEFCGFTIFDDPEAWATLERDYLAPILQTAADHGHGLILDAQTWRAQPFFLEKIGIPADRLAEINTNAVAQTRASIERWRQASGHDEASLPVLVAADIGPRGDGYTVEDASITADAACAYHRAQIGVLADAGVDLVCALTMTSLAESIGIVHAAKSFGLPVIISPTVETDGRLPDGIPLGEFIEAVDAATDSAPFYYMVNCAHPIHLRPALEAARAAGEPWLDRFKGFRANASKKSHEELDDSTELDRGDVEELAREVADMKGAFGLKLIGGCCGTDHEHVSAIARALG